MSHATGASTGSSDTPVAERQSRNLVLFLDACIRPAVIALILWLILAGPVLLVVEVIFHTNFALLTVLPTVIILFVAILCLTAEYYRNLWRQVGVSVRIYSDRLVYMRKGEVVDYRWDDIRKFYCQRVDKYLSHFGLDRHYTESQNRYRFIHENGHQFEFAEQFSRNKLVLIADYVEKGLLERQFPRSRSRLQEGETLQFGPLGLEAQGIQYGRSLLPWDQVDFVGAEDGKVFVRKKDKTFNWCSVKVEKVPSCCLFLALAKERCDQHSSAS